MTAAIPDEARQRLELMLTGQVSSGGAMPIVQPFTHQPGQEKAPRPGRIPLGRLPVVLQRRPGLRQRDRRPGFLQQGAALCRPGRGDRLRSPAAGAGVQPGTHRQARPALRPGRPTGTTACRLGYNGESLFVAFQVRLGLTVYAEIAERLGQAGRSRLGAGAARKAGCSHPGLRLGRRLVHLGHRRGRHGLRHARSTPKARIYLNTQLWSVISGAATPEQAAALHADGQGAAGHPLRADAFRPAVRQNARST